MRIKINCIMLIDDNKDDNFFHERVIQKSGVSSTIIVKGKAQDALDYLKSAKNNSNPHPDLIFLDINMPGMNGWEFLDEYSKLDRELQSRVVITMLTTSENPDDKARALPNNIIADFRTKPLTKEMLTEIADQYFL